MPWHTWVVGALVLAGGFRFAQRLIPNLLVMAIRGLLAQEAEIAQNPGPCLRFLSKPFATELALRLIREALDEASTMNGAQDQLP
jgi:hypothetical protein